MSEIKIVAVIEVEDLHKDAMLPVFKKIVDESRKEDGSVSYDLHVDMENPLKFTILETWKSQEAIDKHNNSSHFKEFTSAIEGKIKNLAVNLMTKVY